MYQVVKDMVDKMGYEVRLSVFLFSLSCYFPFSNTNSYVSNVTKHQLFLQVRLVRVTTRVHEAYFAELYLSKVCNFWHRNASSIHFFKKLSRNSLSITSISLPSVLNFY
jgi:hypothetical protein